MRSSRKSSGEQLGLLDGEDLASDEERGGRSARWVSAIARPTTGMFRHLLPTLSPAPRTLEIDRKAPSKLEHHSNLSKQSEPSKHSKQEAAPAEGDLYGDPRHPDHHKELLRRAFALEHARTTTKEYVTSMFVSRVAIALDRFMLFGVVIGGVALGVFALSMLFELLYPFTDEPDELYNKAKVNLQSIGRFVDLGVTGANAFGGLLRPVIVLWNSFAHYAIEPLIFMVLEVLSVIATLGTTESLFQGIDENTPGFEFKGYECFPAGEPSDPSDGKARAFTAAAWCGMHGFYVNGITGVETAAAWMQKEGGSSHSVSTRRLRELAGDRFALPVDAARRLSFMNDAFVFPTETITALSGFVSKLVGAFVELLGTVVDMLMHVIYIIFDELLTAILGFVVGLLKMMIQVMLSLLRSGIIFKVLGFALDFIIVLAVDVGVPLMMACFDVIFCFINIFEPSTYAEELRCIRKHCSFDEFDLKGPDNIVFTSTYIVLDAVYKAVQDTWHAEERMFGLGDTVNPNAIKKPWQKFDQQMNNSQGCARCFKCKASLTPAIP